MVILVIIFIYSGMHVPWWLIILAFSYDLIKFLNDLRSFALLKEVSDKLDKSVLISVMPDNTNNKGLH